MFVWHSFFFFFFFSQLILSIFNKIQIIASISIGQSNAIIKGITLNGQMSWTISGMIFNSRSVNQYGICRHIFFKKLNQKNACSYVNRWREYFNWLTTFFVVQGTSNVFPLMRICNGYDFEKRHVWSNIASEMVTNTINYTYLKGYILKLNRTYTTLPFASSVRWHFFPSQNWCWKTEYSVGICHSKCLCPNWVELLNGIKKKSQQIKRTMNFKGAQRSNAEMLQSERKKTTGKG